jgi:transcriptional regulator with XRE-family HTH domain
MITNVLTNPLIEELWESFAESKEYRDNFVAAFVKKSIPSQIRAWMKKQGITTQQELAKRSGITQGVISRAANPNYGDLALNTIINIGSGFDCVFVGKYVPYSEFCKMVIEDQFSEDADTMLSFEEEDKKFREGQKIAEEQKSAAESWQAIVSEGQKWLEEKIAGVGAPEPDLASREEDLPPKMTNAPKPPQADVGTSKRHPEPALKGA